MRRCALQFLSLPSVRDSERIGVTPRAACRSLWCLKSLACPNRTIYDDVLDGCGTGGSLPKVEAAVGSARTKSGHGRTTSHDVLTASQKRTRKKAEKEARRYEHLLRRKLNKEKMISSQTSSTYSISTPLGEKKDVDIPLPESYSSAFVESVWYEWWQKSGFFSPDSLATGAAVGSKDRFVLCLPPPNVTGTLHLGHALGNSIQDAIIRWHRMCGREVLWVPGSDHAGIATQVVVEKKLMVEKGLTRHDLGREKFVEEAWKWKKEKGDIIYNQMKKLGSSLDWSRDCFTLDPMHSKAVTEAFVRLHDEGLIYRSMRLVNWSCALKSAISDIEVESVPVEGKTEVRVPGYEKPVTFGQLTSFAYPVIGSDEEVVVATTRLETMLGDVAVAVHPEDTRFSHLHGCVVQHPISGATMPIICDEFVDRKFGTGAVKITPAHDQTDYEVGQRHSLPVVHVISEDGCMINVPEQFLGVKRFNARQLVRDFLQSRELLRGDVEHGMVLPQCSRTGDIIEPLLKEQWYVDCEDMMEQAKEAVKSGCLELVPPQYDKLWCQWLTNSKAWCVSRQLWWGHRIPAFKVNLKSSKDVEKDGEQWVSGRSEAEALRKASAKLGIPSEHLALTQDEDVLDTWFSSALVPFSALGWPEQTSDIKRFYPTDLLETASDILFFWVARMVMLGQHLTGQLPFKQVLLHSILQDRYGRKMSKSLGNIIDPLDIIHGISLEGLQAKVSSSGLSKSEITKAVAGQKKDFPLGIPECGVDALRFTLCSYNYKSQFTNVDVSHIDANRRFCNKIWQAFRFCLQHWTKEFVPSDLQNLPSCATNTDRWMLSRTSNLVQQCEQGFQTYTLNSVTKALHQYWWDFCSIYLEYSKKVLQEGGERAALVQSVLLLCVSTGLRALSPFMPYVTEELFQRLPAGGSTKPVSIMVAPYPRPDQYLWFDMDLETEMNEVTSAVNSILSIKADFGLTKTQLEVCLEVQSDATVSALQHHRELLETLTRSTVSVGQLTAVQDPVGQDPVGQDHMGQDPMGQDPMGQDHMGQDPMGQDPMGQDHMGQDPMGQDLTRKGRTVRTGFVSVPVTPKFLLHLKLEGLLDFDVEITRLQKRLSKLHDEIGCLVKRQDSASIPAQIKMTEVEKLSKVRADVSRIQRALDCLREGS